MPAILALTTFEGVLIFMAGLLIGGAFLVALVSGSEAYVRHLRRRYPGGPTRS